jgi:general secretion pathway protein A
MAPMATASRGVGERFSGGIQAEGGVGSIVRERREARVPVRIGHGRDRMDIRQFSLTRPPFAATPQPGCCFAHEGWQHVLDELVVRLRAGQGTCVLTSPAGLGKTLALKVVAQELHRDFCILSIPAPGVLDVLGLQQSLLAELEVGRVEGNTTEQRLALVHELRGLIRNGRPGVILVDEAQTVAAPLLEELRTLAIQDEEGEPLARILVAGQPAFEETLADPGFEAFNQQIACHKVLDPLGLTESVEYILHRVAWAGGDPESLFSIEALDAVVRAAGGNPRLINRACDLALLLAAAREQAAVDAESMRLALDELQKLPLPWQPIPRESQSAHSPDSAASEPALWSGFEPESRVAGWGESGGSSAETDAIWAPAEEEGLYDSTRPHPDGEPAEDLSCHVSDRPGEGLRNEARDDREEDEPDESDLPVESPKPASSAMRDGGHSPPLTRAHTSTAADWQSDRSPSVGGTIPSPTVDHREASGRSAGRELSAKSPEFTSGGPTGAWPPQVPAETASLPGQDPFDDFDPVPETTNTDRLGEWSWLLPGTILGSQSLRGDRPVQEPRKPVAPSNHGTTGSASLTAQPAQPKFETHVEPPVGVARLPLGVDSQGLASRASVSPGYRASDDAPALARREYGLRGSPGSGPGDGSGEEAELDVVEPELPTGDEQLPKPAEDPDQPASIPTADPRSPLAGRRQPPRPGFGASDSAEVPGSVTTELVAPPPSNRQRTTSGTRHDPQHPVPPAPIHPAPVTPSPAAEVAAGTGATRSLGRLFSALRGRMNSPGR